MTGASAWLAGVRGTPVGWWLSIGITAGWTGLIVFNRLYQGMHTPIVSETITHTHTHTHTHTSFDLCLDMHTH